jgi:hypothetical protein
LLFLSPPPFCWVLCFMEFARVSSFFVAFMSLCHLDQAKPKTVQRPIWFASCCWIFMHLVDIVYTWMDLFFHWLVRTSIRVENFPFTSFHFLSIDLRLSVDEHMNNTVFLPRPIFISICKVFGWTGTSIWKKNGNFKCYYCSTFSGWGVL